MTAPNDRITAARAKAGVLMEALPWISRFSGAVMVFKYGGNAMVSEPLRQAFAADMVFLREVGICPVVVHGGGPQINRMLERLGIESEFRGGLRVTTAEAIDAIRMVLTGQVQRELVSLLNATGPYAVGISGEDASLLNAERRGTVVDGQEVDLGHVGEIVSVNPEPLRELIQAGRIPVISSISPEVDAHGRFTGEVLNINADTAAAAVAVALGAEKLVALTDIEGLYSDWPDRSSLISSLTDSELRELLPSLQSGMIPKMEAALTAVEGGVPRATIVDGREAHSVLLEIFTDEGIGTEVRPDGTAPAAERPLRRHPEPVGVATAEIDRVVLGSGAGKHPTGEEAAQGSSGAGRSAQTVGAAETAPTETTTTEDPE
ncbi:acetylglutamate kinase [Kocuria palustris]|jgi:acetylglutamate kinase|nr:acetylglutamate kinase [Kocuria palustris]MBN6758976.1 acetylglutamate kinase [Kocuria palustris]MBN6764027.1 acetylglutamate kinase [Kocuria palustris]MBN6783544.1 acetylglutamate kinase [Kocuria palustris]MBN6799888.1 acetylglutamate kinase [Kocuria palustris]